MATINTAKAKPVVGKQQPTQAVPTTAPKSKLGREKEVGSIWRKVSKSGDKEYMTGEINVEGGKIDIIIFENSYKEPGSKQPDYRIYLREPLDSQQ